jgi:hypothetical protein
VDAAGRAASIDAAEAFDIENGLLRRIDVIGSSAPYHLIRLGRAQR